MVLLSSIIKKPSFTYKCDYKQIIKDVWDADLSKDKHCDKQLKKMVANINIGLMEKSTKTAQKTEVFSSLDEALSHNLEYGGHINVIHEKVCNDEGRVELVPKYYVLSISDTAILTNGFRFIKELMLQNHNFKMQMAYNKLRANKIDVFTVKTDAFHILSKDLDKTKELLHFGGEIGDWRHSGDVKFIPSVFTGKKNNLIKIPERENITLEVQDEYDTPAIVKQIVDKRVVMIRALYAGSGKSYIAEWMANNGYKVLFVIGTNNLTQECNAEAVTVNKFFAISFGEEKLKPFDYSAYDVIVFDEIYFNSPQVLVKVKQFIQKNPEKIVIGAGDVLQLEAVSDVSNTTDYEEYMNDCIDQIFKYNICLKECKRLNTEEDKLKLKNIREELLFGETPIKEVVEKYFEYTDKIEMCENNIAYTNETCKRVSNEIRRMKNIDEDYIVGDFVICRKYLKLKNCKFNVNIKHEITEVKQGTVELKNVKTNEIKTLAIKYLRSHFTYAYCYTAHSKQGCSVDGEIIVYDWQRWYCSRKWIWVAVTRCRDLNKVKFYKYDVNTITEEEVDEYFNNKVKNYVEQDAVANRTIETDKYVNADWLKARMKGNCSHCGEPYVIEKVDGVIRSNLTAQRKDNNIAHHKDNCIAMCNLCNCSFH